MTTHQVPANHALLTKVLHWTIAPIVVFLFAIGLWMDGLDYYDAWYQKAPALHISVGVVFIALLVLRIINRLSTKFPPALPSHSKLERVLAKIGHFGLYALMCIMAISGYLLAGVEGQGVELFSLLTLPGLPVGDASFEDSLKEFHEICAFALIGLACIHIIAALKHAIFDKDSTLKRML